MPGEYRLSFERPIYELEARIEKLQKIKTPEAERDVRLMRRELTDLKKRTYANLKPWETVEVARCPERPLTDQNRNPRAAYTLL